MIHDVTLEHLVLTDGDVIVRSAHLDDERLLTNWFTDPGVYAYWGGSPLPGEYIRKRCCVETSDNDTAWPFIIVHQGVPAGFIQAWLRADRIGGLDLFVAPAHRRKKIALRALPLLAKYLRDEHGWKRVTVDPRVDNIGAVAFFERAGFTDSGDRFYDGDDLHMLMELR
jgi:aminoglycoside 6'-N-acetyltransferase